MKKMVLTLALSIVCSSAFATPVPAEKLDSYKQAVHYALAKVQLRCSFTPATAQWLNGQKDAEVLNAVIDQSTEADLNQSGTQPVLTFQNNAYYVRAIKVTTSADYKSILAMDYSQYYLSSTPVNLGTIVNPNIIQQPVHIDEVSASCK
jgi:hypothetical protein